MEDFRRRITLDYAKWTALSALRSGAPIKSRKDVYPLLDGVAFPDVLSSSRAISASEFNAWHEIATAARCQRDRRLPTGWSAKFRAPDMGDESRRGFRSLLMWQMFIRAA